MYLLLTQGPRLTRTVAQNAFCPLIDFSLFYQKPTIPLWFCDRGVEPENIAVYGETGSSCLDLPTQPLRPKGIIYALYCCTGVFGKQGWKEIFQPDTLFSDKSALPRTNGGAAS